MNKKKIFKNISYSLISNIISLLISTMVVAIVPKAIGVEAYGYYQLYVFYASYTGFFHFGLCDGIYLKYGGIHYNDYDKPLMSSQFWYLSIFEAILSIVLLVGISFFKFNVDKLFVLEITVISILFIIPKTLLSYLLQISNRIKEYSIVVISERALYFILTIVILSLGFKSYKLLLFADILGKILSFVIGIVYCKDIVFSKMTSFSVSIKEAFDNISIGIKLLAANITGMLILGIIRLAIENNWNIETFGKVSLAISISNLLMVFINAIGVVLFPILKRINEELLNDLYDKIRDYLMVILFLMLISFYPLKIILSLWLPSYVESFTYMSLLFPICIYESKMSLLINTYLKAMRKEKQLLIINVITVILSALLTYVCVYQMHNLTCSIIVIVILFAFRAILSEFILGSYMKKNFKKDILIELIMCLVFMCSSTLLPLYIAFIIYLIACAIYLYYKRNVLIEITNSIRSIKNKKEGFEE